MGRSITETAMVEVADLLSPLQELDSAAKIVAFIEELGWDLGDILDTQYPISVDISQFSTDLEDVLTDIIALAEANEQEATQLAISIAIKVPGMVKQATDIADAIKNIIADLQANPPDIQIIGMAIEEVAELMARRLLDLLLYQYLEQYHQRIFSVLHFLGVAEIVIDDSDMPIKTIHWQKIPELLTSPGGFANRVYEWDSSFLGDKFMERLEILLRAFQIPGGIYTQDDSIRNALGCEIGKDKELRLPFYQSGIWPESYTEIDLNLAPIPEKDEQNKAGLFLYPYLMAGVSFEIDLSDNWKVTFGGNLRTNPNLGLEIRPPVKLSLVNNLFDGNPQSLTTIADSHIEIGISRKAKEEQLTYIFGSGDGSYLGFKALGFNFIVALENGKEKIAAEMLVDDLTLKIDMSQSDGFLQKILSGVKVEIVSDLVMGISNLDGFYFRGSGALEIEIPIHQSLGPVTFHTLYVRFLIAEEMEFQFAVALGFKLGPISGSIEKMGIRIPLSISDRNDGNLGPIDIRRPAFLPPRGAGISLNTAGIVGGGYLEFDYENKRYAGILSLKFGEIALVAIGLISTRMPDGSTGFSLLVNIGVTFNPAIQLSFGFTLNAVGGLIGLNRTMDLEVLQTGIRNGTLNSILFPDPDTVIENAPKIISDLRSVFPPFPDRFVVGPMLKIGWGTPTIITGDIGIFIEFPAPISIVLLGQIEAVLPKKEAAVVEIHLDILGVLDLQKGELTFQASLYDSRLLTYDMYGDSAMLVGWKNEPRFALSMGGFHPSFAPPPPPIIFAGLRRLTISLSRSSNLRLTCAAYHAITPNSLQFGARVDCYVAFGGATVSGYLSFDAIIYFSPFSFVADLAGGVTVKYQGITLVELHLNCTLSGPNPWNARGKVKFKVLFFTVKKSFNITWGDSNKRRLESMDPWPALQEAVEQTGSWSSALPPSSTVVATLRTLEDEETTIAIVHPSGKLELRQNVLPLDVKLDKVGNAPITGHDKFEVEKISFENPEGLEEVLATSIIYEHFSRGQYQNLSDSEKLALPSFEKMKAGIRTENSDFEIFGGIEESELNYEVILVDSNRVAKSLTARGLVPLDKYQFMQRSLADRRFRRSMTGNKFIHPERGSMTSVPGEEEYFVANADDLKSSDVTKPEMPAEGGLSRTAADEILREQTRLSPSMANNMVIVTGDELTN